MRIRGLAAFAACAALAGGCGLGAGDRVGGVSEIVTRDFGSVQLSGSPRSLDAPGGETAMRALQRTFRVATIYGGGFVHSVDGVAGGKQAGRPVDWFYYVNGVEAPHGAAGTKLRRGDVVWWDRHDWGTAQRVPAVVGAFPEPFLHGTGGKRYPARLECSASASRACQTAQTRLGDAGVIAGEAAFDTRGGEDLLRIVVGPWSEIRSDFAARLIGRGPGVSGVFAEFSGDGRSLSVLGPTGAVVQRLGAGSGLIAAVIAQDQPPTWVVTGTDAAGVARAADSLTTGALRDHFALAVQGTQVVPVPKVGP